MRTRNVHERVQGSSDAHVYLKHERVKTTRLIVHDFFGVTIALEPLKMMRQPVEQIVQFLHGQQDSKTVHDRTAPVIGPQSDPITARLTVGVDFDNIATRFILDRTCRETIAEEHRKKIRGQVGIVVSQLLELLIARRNEFHSSTVDVAQNAIVIIDLHYILKFCIDQHRDGMACRGIKFEL